MTPIRTETPIPAAPKEGAKEHGEIVLSLRATVLDIGISGLAIETDTRLVPQHAIGMRIGSTRGNLDLTGRVAWCFFHGTATASGGEQMPIYRAGIEFGNVLTPSASELLRFLEANAVVTIETRLFGRFRLEESGPVAVHSTAPFRFVELQGQSLVVEARLGLEPSAGSQAALRIEGDTGSWLATITDLGRSADGEAWRMTLAFDEPPAVLLARARELLGA